MTWCLRFLGSLPPIVFLNGIWNDVGDISSSYDIMSKTQVYCAISWLWLLGIHLGRRIFWKWITKSKRNLVDRAVNRSFFLRFGDVLSDILPSVKWWDDMVPMKFRVIFWLSCMMYGIAVSYWDRISPDRKCCDAKCNVSSFETFVVWYIFVFEILSVHAI
jgi:hypothetical protein